MSRDLTRPCLECRKPYTRHGKGDFCSAACKAVFHNRRAKRGAALYDAVMLKRQHPTKTAGWEDRIELLLATWEEEDKLLGRIRTTKALYDVGYELPRIDVVKSYA